MKLLVLDFFILFSLVILFDECKSETMMDGYAEMKAIMLTNLKEHKEDSSFWCKEPKYTECLDALRAMKDPQNQEEISKINGLFGKKLLKSDANISKALNKHNKPEAEKALESELLRRFLGFAIGQPKENEVDAHYRVRDAVINHFEKIKTSYLEITGKNHAHLVEFINKMNKTNIVRRCIDICENYLKNTTKKFEDEINLAVKKSKSPIILIYTINETISLYKDECEDEIDLVKDFRDYLHEIAIIEMLVKHRAPK